MKNCCKFKNRDEFRKWLISHHSDEKECWIFNLKRGKPIDSSVFYYIDAVEEALCFGWIKKIGDDYYQKFSPRLNKSNWTVLNIARVKRLEQLGLMTDDGLKIVPNKQFVFDSDVINDIKKAGVYEQFKTFPDLYQKIRVSTLYNIKKISIDKYNASFNHFIKLTKQGKMIKGWDDYGRLS